MDDNIVYLCNCYMLDVNHEHTVNFNNKQSQLQWFNSKCLYYMKECKHLKKGQTVIVPINYYDNKLLYCNYCYFVNDENRIEYYFIIEREYVNEYNTKLYLKLDVFQTYYFDISFSKYQSFIDRVHLPRWNDRTNLPNTALMLEDEGLEVGEYEIRNRTTLYNYSNKGSFIATSSSPLSAKTGGSGSSGGSGGSSSSGTLWKNGLVSEDGFVFIKSVEGFSSKPYNLGDGTYTIGYGTTSVHDPEHYNQLAPECTEEQASNVFANSLDNNYANYVLTKIKQSGRDLSTVKQCHFDAFCCFYYNTGKLTNQTIWTKFVNGDNDESIAEVWRTTIIMPGSQFEEGLRDRRSREADVFLNNYRPKLPIQNLSGGTVSENGGKGYVPERYVYIAPDVSAIRQSIVASAKKLLGKPYVYGGNYPPLGSDSGTDCSGLMQWAYNDNGIKISRTTYTQIKEGKLTTKAGARPGDLVFTRGYGDNGHVVMFLSHNDDGSIHVIEAKQTGTNIMENDRTPNEQYMFRNLLGD